MAERGHFEVYYGEAEREIGQSSGEMGWLWRFVDPHGEWLAHSERAYPDPDEAKEAVVDFLAVVRAATYGQRLAETIKDAVRVVD